jgi:hypothetical protein
MAVGLGLHGEPGISEQPLLSAAVGCARTVAEVDARSYARPDRNRTIRRRGGVILDLDPSPGLFRELIWLVGGPPDTLPSLTLNLVGVAGLTVDVARAGLAALPRSTIAVATDTTVEIKLAALPPGVTVRLDDNPTDSTVPVPPGRHRITLAAEGEQPRWFM